MVLIPLSLNAHLSIEITTYMKITQYLKNRGPRIACGVFIFMGMILGSRVYGADIEIPYVATSTTAWDFSQNTVSHPVQNTYGSGGLCVGIFSGSVNYSGSYPDTSSPYGGAFPSMALNAGPFITGTPWLRSQYSDPTVVPYSLPDGTYWSIADVADCNAPHTPTGDNYYFQFTLSGGHLVPPTPPTPPDTSTRIDTVTPINDATVATGTVAIAATGYINPADYSDDTKIVFHIQNNYSAYNAIRGVSVFTIVEGLGIGSATSTSNTQVDYSISFQATSSGAFSVATTTDMQVLGIRNMTTSVTSPRFSFLGLNIGTNNVVSTSTKFTVATTTVEDNIVETAGRALIALSDQNDQRCDEFVTGSSTLGATNVGIFVRCLFTPTTLGFAIAIQGLKDEILSRWPLGYATRLLVILNSTATTSLPTGSWVSPSTLGPFGNYQVDIDPWTVLRDHDKNPFYWDDINYGGVSSSTAGVPLWDKVEPIYTPIIYAIYIGLFIWFVIWRRK